MTFNQRYRSLIFNKTVKTVFTSSVLIPFSYFFSTFWLQFINHLWFTHKDNNFYVTIWLLVKSRKIFSCFDLFSHDLIYFISFDCVMDGQVEKIMLSSELFHLETNLFRNSFFQIFIFTTDFIFKVIISVKPKRLTFSVKHLIVLFITK